MTRNGAARRGTSDSPGLRAPRLRAHTLRARVRLGARAFVVAIGLSLASGGASAQTIVEDGVVTRMEPAPERLGGIDIQEHLNQVVPLGLTFKTTRGQAVRLSELVRGERPVIFTLNYSDCPMLCSLQLNGLVTALGQLDRVLGRDFEIVTISLDPNETSEQARQTEQRYLTEAGASGGWHFLTGDKVSIDAIAGALGISYAYNEKRREYVHPASLVITTPGGRISRYLYGIEYLPKTLSLSLVEAAEGKIGTSLDRLILYCFHYDETEGRYAPVAMNIMRVGGGLTAIALGAFLGSYWLRHGRRKQGVRTPAEHLGS